MTASSTLIPVTGTVRPGEICIDRRVDGKSLNVGDAVTFSTPSGATSSGVVTSVKDTTCWVGVS